VSDGESIISAARRIKWRCGSPQEIDRNPFIHVQFQAHSLKTRANQGVSSIKFAQIHEKATSLRLKYARSRTTNGNKNRPKSSCVSSA
jgi:hypothetical protein